SPSGSSQETAAQDYSEASRFYSPLVKSIAREEQIELKELENIQGSGKEGRVTKNDILAYVENRSETTAKTSPQPAAKPSAPVQAPISVNGEDEIIAMSRMGKMVAKHMTSSIQTSAHVQSFIEVDVTKIWNWRNR